MLSPLRISNLQARSLLLSAYGLSTPAHKTGEVDAAQMVKALGYVQLDTIRTVSRAHHHILWSRNARYREPMLGEALASGQVFEHFTHDASLLALELYPDWRWQFDRFSARLSPTGQGDFSPALLDDIRSRIRREGPLSTHAFQSEKPAGKAMWARPAHKRALDYLWYCGELATSHRENFTKFYDLRERVIPQDYRDRPYEARASFHKLCARALSHLLIASPAQLKDFWGAASAAQVQNWIKDYPDHYVPVLIEGAKGETLPAIAVPDIEARLADLPAPSTDLKILSPFDPLIRDRKRLLALFGFDYRIEIFVPSAARQWGYYVYPVLEGTQFIARIELKADRKTGIMQVIGFWPQPGIRWTKSKSRALSRELASLGALSNTPRIMWAVPAQNP